MTDNAPILIVFAMLFTSMGLLIAAVFVWGLGQLKRVRMSCAATQMNDILKLANEALRSGSREQQDVVNSRIEEWDQRFSKELGVEVIKLTPAVAS